MSTFLDILNKTFAPKGEEWVYSRTMIEDPQNEWDDIMNLGGGQPTYTLQNKRKDSLTSAPPSVYNRPDPRDMGPKFIPQEADVAVSIPTVEVPVVPTAQSSGRNNAAQQKRIRTAKAERAANQLRGGAASAAQPSEELYRRNLSGRNLTVRGGPMATTGPVPLQGEFIPRQERLSQIRPALPQPALEGEVVRSDRKLGTDPEWVRRLLQLSRGPALAAFSPRLLADDAYMGGMMGGPFEGFSFVPSQPDYTLGGMLRPQSFDTINDLLINQYLEGISPWADVTYYR